MKYWLAAVAYVLMMFFTNAYCQVHRWQDWKEQCDGKCRTGTFEAGFLTMSATAMWPIYWASRASIWLVEHPPTFGEPDAKIDD